MNVFAIADLHLAFGVPSKTMEVFGEGWHNYSQRLKENWEREVSPNDLVLIPGDISWAKNLEEAIIDLNWIEALPGTKLLLKGNHDYWWGSLSKVKAILPASIHLLQNNAFNWNDISIAGTRLWDTPEYNYSELSHFVENPVKKGEENKRDEIEEERESFRIFERELGRLELSLKELNKKAKIKIAMTHYPPISPTLKPSRTSYLLEKYGVDICVFGHIHNVKEPNNLIGESRGIKYYLTAADYLKFNPLKIATSGSC